MIGFVKVEHCRMRELSGSGQQVLDAVIGGVSPKYIHILVPSETTHTLEP